MITELLFPRYRVGKRIASGMTERGAVGARSNDLLGGNVGYSPSCELVALKTSPAGTNEIGYFSKGFIAEVQEIAEVTFKSKGFFLR
jgi:hypothetical protein